MDFFNINGDELTASVEETGYKHYTMKLTKTFHIGINFLSFIKELKLSPRLSSVLTEAIIFLELSGSDLFVLTKIGLMSGLLLNLYNTHTSQMFNNTYVNVNI